MGNAPLLSKAANFLVADVQLNRPNVDLAMNIVGAGDVSVTASVLDRFQKIYGGLWVGGKVMVSKSEVRLSANTANRTVSVGTLDIELPLSQIQKVTIEGGFLTKIVRLDTDAGTVKFRCWRASAVANLIKESMIGVNSI